MRNGSMWRACLIAAVAAAGVLFHTAAEAVTRFAVVNNGVWATAATWRTGAGAACGSLAGTTGAPAAGDDVIICSGITVLIGANTNTVATITIQNTGVLLLGNTANARTLNVSGDITINNGGTLGANPAFTATHILAHAGQGNIINNGTINFAPNANALCNATFTLWTGTRTISGTGTSSFNRITVNGNGTTVNNIIDVTAANFTMATIGGAGLTITDGTFRLSTAATIAPFGTGAFTLAVNDRFWLSHPGAVVNHNVNASFLVSAGELRIDAGTFNVGTSSDNELDLVSNATSRFEMNGGALNISGRFASSSVTGLGTFVMTGGTITSGIVGNTRNNADGSVFMIGSNVSYTQSGGTIVIENPSSANNAREYDVRSTTASVTGGTLQIGNASSAPSARTYEINSVPPVWNVDIVNNGTPSNPVAELIANLTIDNNLTIGNGTTLTVANNDITIRGNWINNGASNSYVTNNGTVTFAGTAAQSLLGTATETIINRLIMNNTTAAIVDRKLTLNHDLRVTNSLTLTSGRIASAGSNTNPATPKTIIPSGASISAGSSASFVSGRLQVNIPNGNKSADCPIGTEGATPPALAYSPANFNFSGVGGGGGEAVCFAVQGDHPSIGTSTLDAAKSVNRYWVLTGAGVSGTPADLSGATMDTTFTFLNPEDLDGGTNTANFETERLNGGTWFTPGPGTRTATTTQALSVNDFGEFAVAEKTPVVVTPGDFNAFESSTAANAITGRIFTKLVSTNFSLDVVAILGGAQFSTFTNTVLVDLVTGSTGGLNCPGAPVAIAGTSQNVNLTNGRGTTAAFNVASAFPDVRVRVRYPVASPTVTSCSTDNFTIRPLLFTVTSTNATQTGSSGAPAIKTGANFNLTATAVAGYNGTPAIDNTRVVGTPTAGTIGGSFSAAPVGTGIATGSSFFYSEVGNFGLNADAVRDTAFTVVDQAGGDCVAASTSNALSGGQYGCSVGSTAVAQTTGSSGFGRFIPDNFNVTYTTAPIFGTGCGIFTYVGARFTFPIAVLTVTARNGTANGLTNAPTVNYAGAYMKLSNAAGTSLNQAPYNTQDGRYSRFDALGGGLTPVLDTTGLPATTADPAIGVFAGGSGTLTFDSNNGLAFTRSLTTPTAPFDADIALALNVIDTDGVVFAGNPAAFGNATAPGGGILFSGGKDMRYGRLRLGNANGSNLLPLTLRIEAQHWLEPAPGKGYFVTNTADSCTVVATANVGVGNFRGGLVSGDTTPSIAAGALSAGIKSVVLSAPGGAKTGSVDVVLNLAPTAGAINPCVAFGAPAPTPTAANLAYLRGQWCGASADRDPVGRARFGSQRGGEEFIYFIENF